MQIKLKIDNFNLYALDTKKSIGYFCEIIVFICYYWLQRPRGNGFGVFTL